jgi:hypothetical protein
MQDIICLRTLGVSEDIFERIFSRVPTAFSFTSKDPDPAKLFSSRRSSNSSALACCKEGRPEIKSRLGTQKKEALYQENEIDIIKEI